MGHNIGYEETDREREREREEADRLTHLIAVSTPAAIPLLGRMNGHG